MSFATLHKIVTYLFATLGFLALVMGAELGPFAIAFVVVGTIASLFVEGPLLARLGTSRFWSITTVAVFVLQVARAFAGASAFSLGMEYAAFLQVTRLADRRSATEHLHVVGLAFLHLVIGAVLTSGLDFAFVFLGFVIATPWMLTLTHLRGEIERRYGAPLEGAVATDRIARALASKGLAGRGFLVGSSLLALPLVIVTATFFLAFPRVGLGFLNAGERGRARVAGFGNEVDLSGFGTIRDDPTVVVRVFPPGLSEDPAVDVSFRLRGTSFDRYDGLRWTRDADVDRDVQRRFGVIDLGTRGRIRSTDRYRFLVEPLEDPVLFLPEGTVAVEVAPRIENGLDRPRTIQLRSGLDVRLGDPDGLDLDYVADVDPAFTGRPEKLSPDAVRRLTALPDHAERITALASTIVTGATAPRDEAMRLLAELRDSGHYRYSLDVEDPGRRDPLELFLFETKRGHCEFFSTALAVLLRARGIPARNVTGFLGGRYNSYGRYYALRQGDAHSWVEAWIDGEWVTLDATPPSRDAVRPDEGVLATMREMLDALRTRWARDIVGYDMRRQVSLFLELRAVLRRMRTDSATPRESGAEHDPRAWLRRAEGPVGFVLAGALLGVLFAFVVFAADRIRGRSRIETDATERVYRDLEALLAKQGKARPRDRTPLEHARALEAEGFEGAALVRRVTDVYARHRYGDEPLPSDTEAELRALLRELSRRPSAR